MSLTIEKLNNATIEKYIKSFPDFTYSAEFDKFQRTRANCQSIYLGVYEKRELLSILPLNIIDNDKAYSVYKDYAYPFVLTDKIIDWTKLTKIIRQSLKLRYCKLYLAGVSNASRGDLSNFTLNLNKVTSLNDIWYLYHKKTRNEVKKAISYSFKTMIAGCEQLNDFYNLYLENMQRHHSFARDKQYFTNLFNCFQDKCKLITVHDGDRLIGANLILLNNQYLRLVFNISRVEYWPKCVNNLLYHQTIIFAWKQGVKTVDFGPGLITDHSHNKFKLGFGAGQEHLSEYVSGRLSYSLKFWLKQKIYNLSLRFNKYGHIVK